jgi:ApaG protein
MATRRPFYYKETLGIRITVKPFYLPTRSQPELRRYVFAYAVRIENTTAKTVQLLSRYWFIHDDGDEDYEVAGDGVVGEQPVLAPGGVHEYQSFCVLKSPSGYMEGSYRFIGRDDVLFDALIPRFILDAYEHTDSVG